MLPRSPELLAERAKRSIQGSKCWDKVIMGLFGLETVARYVVAGLDERWGWAGSVPLPLEVLGAVMSALGFAMVAWSMSANAFFAITVKLQQDRGQTVVTGGPYRFVRHPGYVGTIGFEIGTGLLLGSWWAVALGACGALLMVVRTGLEDRMLHEELDGYADFAKQTRFRMVPGVW